MKQMKIVAAALAIGAIGGVALSASAPAPAKFVRITDWTRTVVATPQGGMAMGNPNAKVKLVEYGSLVCSHCRHFAAEAMAPLKNGYIKSGLVRFEFRSFLLNGSDLAATLVARCGGPQRFFPMAETMFATQPAWYGRIEASQDRLDAMQGLSSTQQVQAIARAGGLPAMAAAKGISAARTNACLADQKAAGQLNAWANAGRSLNVQGTPTFFLNGRLVEGNDWASVEAAIKAAR